MTRRFVLCINDGGYPECLEKRKFYETIEDSEAAKIGMLRVIDESGEDYPYNQELFLDTSLPAGIEDALKKAA